MVRECLRRSVLAVLGASCLGGCSLVLDFSDGAAPHDGAIDAPYTQEQCAHDEPNDSIDTATMLAMGDTGPAAICPTMSGEDHDFYRFTVGTAASVAVSVLFTNRPGGDLDLKLYDLAMSPPVVIAQSRGFSDNEAITCPGASPPCPMLAAGDYAFEVFPAVAGAANAYTFTVTQQ